LFFIVTSVNELVTNAYKHLISRDSGKIYLELKKESRYFQLIVRDSGIEFSPDNVKKSLGLTLIYALVEEQLKGKISFRKEPNSSYYIRFNI
jgi:two-component sensor histidine kinase